MELLQLKYFQVVAKHEHMTQAAEELNISQPSLSKVINRLEGELGVLLFDRQGRNIRLNAFGKSFLDRVERIFRELEDGKKEITDMNGSEQGKISLAVTSLSLFSTILEGFVRKHPNVRFRQVISSTAEIKRQLEAGEIDLCITSPPIEGAGIVCTPLITEEVFLAVPKGHRFAGRESIDLSEAAQEAFVSMKKGYGFRDITDEFCRKAGFEPDVVFEGEVAGVLYNLINAGLGISFLPDPGIRGISFQMPELVRISNPVCRRTISLSYLKGHYLSNAAKELCNYVILYFKNNETE